MEYPGNLIHFSTKHADAHQLTKVQRIRRMLRPRVVIYSALLLLVSIGLVVSLAYRPQLKVDVIRDRGVMARLLSDGQIENVYRLQITNATESAQTYQIKVQGLDGIQLLSNATVKVNATSEQSVPMSLRLPDGLVKAGIHAIQFVVSNEGSDERIVENSVFYMPN